MLQALIKRSLRVSLRYGVKPILKAGIPIPIQRQWVEFIASFGPIAPNVKVSTLDLSGISVDVLVPPSCGPGVVLYFHGGAYCIGSPRTHQSLTSHLAHYAQAAVWVADYSRAPEAPFPVALNEAHRLYETVLSRGFEPANIVLAGDSAGGGLALALAVKLRDEGRSLPAGLVLLSPYLDLWRREKSSYPEKKDPILSRRWLDQCARHYLSGEVNHPEYASPLMADMRGLPPVLIQVSTDEILLEDSRELVEKLRSVGGKVSYQEFQNLWHVFQLHAGWLAAADEALQGVAGFMRRNALLKKAAIVTA
ncbi:MAG: alpha/beta hydrolase [Hahellaceae bacterium]|nr:alpha/beta hydrolase [Hahellaceae bacterium]